MENLSTPQPTNTKPADNTATNLVLPTVGQQLTYPLDYTTQEILRDFMRTVSSQAFPVGSIFISVDSTNPATTLGYGTWTAFGAGRTLVGFDSGQTEFDTVEETGGAKTHQLSINELPSHSHAGNLNSGSSSSFSWSSVAGNSALTSTGATGNDQPHNNLQPYIVTYFFKRTA
jgi:hypothetical protein